MEDVKYFHDEYYIKNIGTRFLLIEVDENNHNCEKKRTVFKNRDLMNKYINKRIWLKPAKG